MEAVKKIKLKGLIDKSATMKSVAPQEKERIMTLFMDMDDSQADAVIKVLEVSDEKILEMTDKMTASSKKVDDLMMQLREGSADLKRMLIADRERSSNEQEQTKTDALMNELEDI